MSTEDGTPVDGRRLTVLLVKHDGSESWRFATRLLSRDAAGLWLFVPDGTPFRKPGVSYESVGDCVMRVPFGEWWCARFGDEPPASVSAYVDVIAPVRAPVSPELDELRIVDLDLDVVVSGGVPRIDDEDEFEENAAAMRYPPRLRESARRCADDLIESARRGKVPFDQGTRERVDELAALGTTLTRRGGGGPVSGPRLDA